MKIRIDQGMKVFFLILVFLLFGGSAQASDYYVSTSGSDSNSGLSISNPFKTIQKAADIVLAGDTVYVRGGTYKEQITIKNSGKEGSPITFMAYPGEHPIIDGGSLNVSQGLFYISGKSYIVIDGFEIRNSNNYLILGRDSNNCTIKNCLIHDNEHYDSSGNLLCYPDSGRGVDAVFFVRSDYITYENNEVYHGGHNGLSCSACNYWTVQYNHVHDNYCHNCVNTFPATTDNPQPTYTGGKIIYNNLHACKNIILFRYQKDMTIANNLIYDTYSLNEGNRVGIYIQKDTTTGITNYNYDSNVKIYNNVFADIYNSAILNENANSIDVRNNIFSNIGGKVLRFSTTIGDNLNNNIYNDSGLSFTWGPASYSSLSSFVSATGQDKNSFEADPLFVNSSANDYHINSNDSLAVDSGVDVGISKDFDGNAIPVGSAPDIGAYEYGKLLETSKEPVAYWNFDEGAGEIAKDVSGDNDGTLKNGASWTNGLKGSAVFFDGVDDFIEVPDSSSLNPTGQMTISLWIKIADQDLDKYMRIVAKKQNWNDSEGYQFEYNPYSDEMTFFGSGASYDRASVSLDNNWHQVSAVVDGNIVNYYVDGQLAKSDAQADYLVASQLPLYIGKQIGNENYFKGTMDELRIYNRALSAEEINDLYNSTLPICKLISASWSKTQAYEGEIVQLNVISENCSEKNFNYVIKEDDGLFPDDTIENFTSTSLNPDWKTVNLGDQLGNPEYYFEVSEVGNESNMISSSKDSELVVLEGCEDADNDGFDSCNIGDLGDDGKRIDCDDKEYFTNPEGIETCDNLDNNCDSQIDENCDQDGDGYCNSGMSIYQNTTMCHKTLFVSEGQSGDDCNDSNININPGVIELCGDGIDNNCSGGDVVCPDNISPEINNFEVSLGNSVDINWDVSDDNNLDKIELWRTDDVNGSPDDVNFELVNSSDLSGLSAVGTNIDNLLAGTWWYKIKVFDSSGNWSEKNSPNSIEISYTEACVISDSYLVCEKDDPIDLCLGSDSKVLREAECYKYEIDSCGNTTKTLLENDGDCGGNCQDKNYNCKSIKWTEVSP